MTIINVIDRDYHNYIVDFKDLQNVRGGGYNVPVGTSVIEGIPTAFNNDKYHFHLNRGTSTPHIHTLTHSINISPPDTYQKHNISLNKLHGALKFAHSTINAKGLIQFEMGRYVWGGKDLLMGTDPELFVLDTSNQVIPSWMFLPKQPVVQPAYGQAYAYQDGFQAELYTRPEKCLAYLIDRIQNSLYTLYEKAKAYDSKATLSWKTIGQCPMSDSFSDEQIQLGCAPSFNAYNLSPKLEGVKPRQYTKRPIGMHMHFGCGVHSHKHFIKLTRLMDRIVGIPSVSILRGLEHPNRRKYYGLPGEYRTPTHGYEYRTISSAALVHPAVTHLHFELGRFAHGLLNSDQTSVVDEILDSITDEEVVDIITNLKVITAKNWSHKLFGIANSSLKNWRDVLACPIQSSILPATAFISKGAYHFIDTDAFVENWQLSPNNWTNHCESANTSLLNFSIKEKEKGVSV